VITTTTTPTGVVAESANYLDVGLKVEAAPEVMLDDEVGIKISLEVSSIVREVRTRSGSLVYQVGTRTAETLLQLRDGETQVLAGLISDEERRNTSKVPLLGDVPILGRLFSTRGVNQSRSEIVLLVTPRILRGYQATTPMTDSFYSGSESQVASRPIRLAGPDADDTSPDPPKGRPEALAARVPSGTAPAPPLAEPPRAVELALRARGDAAKGKLFDIAIEPAADVAVGGGSIEVGFDVVHLTAPAAQPPAPGWNIAVDNVRGRVTFTAQQGVTLARPTPPVVRFEVAPDAIGIATVRVERVALTGAQNRPLESLPANPLQVQFLR
jgi:general secretion pathway protein D